MLITNRVVQEIRQFSSALLTVHDTTLFSDYEYQSCLQKANPAASLAGIWCAKTALIEAIRTLCSDRAIAQFSSLELIDFEIRHDPNGRPKIEMSDRLRQWCDQQGITIDVSISHSGDYAAAGILIRDSKQPPCSL